MCHTCASHSWLSHMWFVTCDCESAIECDSKDTREVSTLVIRCHQLTLVKCRYVWLNDTQWHMSSVSFNTCHWVSFKHVKQLTCAIRWLICVIKWHMSAVSHVWDLTWKIHVSMCLRKSHVMCRHVWLKDTRCVIKRHSLTRVKCVTPYVSFIDTCQLSTLVCLLREISPSALMSDNLSALTFALGSWHGSDTCASYVNDTCELSSGVLLPIDWSY